MLGVFGVFHLFEVIGLLEGFVLLELLGYFLLSLLDLLAVHPNERRLMESFWLLEVLSVFEVFGLLGFFKMNG